MDVIVVTMLFGVLGIVIGYKAGLEAGKTAESDRQYWMRNVAALLIGVVISAVVAATGLLTLMGLSLGLIGGAVAGLKFGYGKSVGLWRKHDTVFRVSAVVAATGLLTLMGLSLGLIGGAVAGLKFGYGKSVGLWRKHDTVFRVNKDQVAAADSAKQARDEGMTEEERAKRDLVSVGSAPQNRGSNKQNQKKGR